MNFLTRQTRMRWLVWIGPGLCAALLLGCGGSDGPPRYKVQGKITFAGKPILTGSVSMTPDTSKGNRGPGSFAPIRDGYYCTPRGQGVVGGPHVLLITGLDRIPGSGPPGEVVPPLFSEYQVTVDFPRENTTYDIDVPASAANSR